MNPTEQRMKNLAKGDAIRLGRADVKRKLRARQMPLGEALGKDCVQGMRVWDLLIAQYRWGEMKTASVMSRCRVPFSAVVRDLGQERRRWLCKERREDTAA